MSESQQSPQLSGNMFLFERPELLNKEQHGQLGMSNPGKRFGFCSKVRAIPITVTEVPAASKDYPIVFMGKENPVLLAVVGLIDDVNLFVDENGDWENKRYIPGYARRYPFGLANETGSDRMAIVLDAAYVGVKTNGELPLFQDGEPTELTQSAIDFCQAFEQDRILTDGFNERLKPYDIIQGQSAHFTPEGTTEQKVFAEYFGIDENKLNALTDEQFISLRQEGALAIIYALIMSMGNWRMLLQRRADRFGLTEDKILQSAFN